MKREFYFQQLKEMILKNYLGEVFMIKDIKLNIPYESIKKYLQRLEKHGYIRRAIRGVYYVPTFSKTLKKECRPNYEKIIFALAKSYNWKILPSVQTILNSIGLDTQVSSRIEFITSGPNKVYEIFGLKIYLKHSCDNFIFTCSYPTMMFVQAVKAIDFTKISNDQIEQMNFFFNDQDKKTIANEIKFYKKPFIEISNLLN